MFESKVLNSLVEAGVIKDVAFLKRAISMKMMKEDDIFSVLIAEGKFDVMSYVRDVKGSISYDVNISEVETKEDARTMKNLCIARWDTIIEILPEREEEHQETIILG